jgi:VIT1/CCC1 family predicted Fe2+/Mn2+ transporter
MLTRNLEKAKDAYLKNDKKASKAAHEVKAAEEKHQSGEGQYIKSAVYGGLDGIITTFAVVAGVAGASLNAGVVLILGFANLIGDGLSMAIGDFLSTKAENEYHQAEKKREAWEAENYPEGEKKEMVEIYMAKGMSKPDAEKMVNTMAKYKGAWVDIMMLEELGIVESKESPLKNAIVTFLSFCIFGLIPLLSYLFASFVPIIMENTFTAACILTAITLFILGAVKVKVTGKNWFKSGMEMVIVGGIASAAAYLIGFLLQGLA